MNSRMRMATLLAGLLGSAAALSGEPASGSPQADHPAVKMPANSWLEVPNTKMQTVAPSQAKFPKTWGVCGPASVVSAWSGGALDSKRSRLVLWGGGHADYAGNEVYVFDINKLAWERLTDPFPTPVKDQEVNADGTPNSRHTYGTLAYIAHADRFFGVGGSLYGVGFAKCDLTWTFDFDTKKWENRNPSGNGIQGVNSTCAYDPATKKVWFCFPDGGGWAHLASYDYDAKKWTEQSTGGADLAYGGCAVDTKRGLLVVMGGGKMKAFNLRADKLTAEVWQTTGGEEFLKQGGVGFEYDQTADKLVGWNGGKVYVLDPEKKAWTVNDPPGAPKPCNNNGIYGRWRYVPSVNAFVLVTGIDANVHFYKLTAGPAKPAN
jgi:hypothetical protein